MTAIIVTGIICVTAIVLSLIALAMVQLKYGKTEEQ